MKDMQTTDVLVVGAGLAGISVALSLPKHLNVLVLSKDALSECSSHYAQGGIAASIATDDSVSNHVQDTLVAGDGLCDIDTTTKILSDGRTAIEWLYQHAVTFTSNTPTPNINNHITDEKNIEINTLNTLNQQLDNLHLTKEGGHSHRRVIHADDATGKHIMRTLWQQLTQHPNVTLLTHHECLELTTNLPDLTEQATTKATCTGAWVIDTTTQTSHYIKANAVVLATGGLGRLFERATAPHIAMGDGVMMAWQAGCRLANLEFVQFHPTGLAVEGSRFLISEAVRGEGGLLTCPNTGKRFMPEYDERAELAPRDVVSRAIYKEIQKNGKGYVHLNISHLDANTIQQHFPTIYHHCLNIGIDITKAPIPVAPTAHYSCGGVLTDVNGVTDVTALYAVGEVAYTGLHGANRLASNSLLECVVVGRNAANHISSVFKQTSPTNLAGSRLITGTEKTDTPELNYRIVEQQLTDKVGDSDSNPITATKSETTDYPEALTSNLNQLKKLMSQHMGIIRDEQQLADAIHQLHLWLDAIELNSQKEPLTDNITNLANITPDQLAQTRWQRLLTLCLFMLQSAKQRTESRGGHYRKDYTQLHKAPWISIIEAA